MPEGDTLFRTAATLHRWLAGRRVTAASAKVDGLPAAKLVGQTVDSVEAQGKHLLIRLDSGQVLHSHMRMTGSWHVYRDGARWQKPPHEARVVLACGDRLAVCFSAPVVELLQPRAEHVHPALTRLGPDILADPSTTAPADPATIAHLDLPEIRRRARRRPPHTPLGELLLDQTVVAGIGNIWRCETLFAERRNPWTPVSALTDDGLDDLIRTASRLMRAQLGPWSAEHGPRWVYNRAGRPCPRCREPIQARRQSGDLARTTYWCPACQP